jgi:hypothetical protein
MSAQALELARHQIDRLVAAARRAPDQIHDEIADLQHGCFLRDRGPSCQRIEAGQKFGKVERLAEIVVGAGSMRSTTAALWVAVVASAGPSPRSPDWSTWGPA